jgi:tetratricopeptide (TPR) repeat protein
MLGHVLARADNPKRAEELIQAGLRELPNQPEYALDRVSCLLQGSAVARDTGDVKLGIARVQEAQEALAKTPFDPQMQKLRVFMDLAEAYREAGQLPQAIAAFQQASVELTALGADDTETAGTLFNNWALALGQMGRPLDGEKLFRRAIDISRADETDRGVSPMLLSNYASSLEDLARFDQATRYAERAYARAVEAGDEVVINQSLMTRGRLYRAQHEVKKADAVLAEVEPRLRKDLPPGHYAFASLTSDHSLVELERGNNALALSLANQALDKLNATVKSGMSGIAVLPLLYQRRGIVELRSGNADAAAADFSKALELLQGNTTPGVLSSRSAGHIYF